VDRQRLRPFGSHPPTGYYELTEGSTQEITMVVTHAGIVKTCPSTFEVA
jgi:hypothetical protein